MTREQKRLQAVAVSDDESQEKGIGVQPNQWCAFVTVGPIYFGKVIAITPTDYVLAEASWIAETGRLNEFVKDPSSASEAEYVGNVAVPRGAVMGTYFDLPKGAVKTK